MFVSPEINDALKRIGEATCSDLRLKILELLFERGPMYGSGIARSLGVPSNSLHHHIKNLLQSGLICKDTQGRRNFYKISPKGWEDARSVFDNVCSAIERRINPVLNHILDMITGMYVRKARQERHLSVIDFGDKIRTPAKEILELEDGTTRITDEKMQINATALETEVQDILGAASIRELQLKLSENPDFLASCIAEYSRWLKKE